MLSFSLFLTIDSLFLNSANISQIFNPRIDCNNCSIPINKAKAITETNSVVREIKYVLQLIQ